MEIFLLFEVVSDPLGGTVGFVGNYVTYTPNPDFNGTDSFTYWVEDPEGAHSVPATVTVTVTAVNDGPRIGTTGVSVDEDGFLEVALDSVIFDVDGPNLTYTVESSSSHGVDSIDGDMLTYRPSPDYFGADSLVLSATDGEFSVSTVVSLTVNPINDAPRVVDYTGVLDEDTSFDFTLLVTEVDGEAFSIVVSEPLHGELVETGVGSYTYTPDSDFLVRVLNVRGDRWGPGFRRGADQSYHFVGR